LSKNVELILLPPDGTERSVKWFLLKNIHVGMSTLATGLILWEFFVLYKLRFSVKLSTFNYFKTFRAISRELWNALGTLLPGTQETLNAYLRSEDDYFERNRTHGNLVAVNFILRHVSVMELAKLVLKTKFPATLLWKIK
jgi:hypothetical protein